MMPYVSHALITYAIPLLAGCAAAVLVGRLHRPWQIHAVACLASSLLSLVLQYGSFLVLGGMLHGDWPQDWNPAGLLVWFTWFAVIASFTAVPLVLGSYVGLLAILSQRTYGHPAN